MNSKPNRKWYAHLSGIDVLLAIDPAQRPQGWDRWNGRQANDWIDAQEAAGVELRKGPMVGFHS